MKLYSINTGYFKLDGGAMFGVVPKSLWQKVNPADENNMCSWALRCLLIENGNQLILIDNGMGDKQSEKFFSYYYLHGDDSLEKSLAHYHFTFDDITDVFLTHLHFDHCGGSVRWNDDRTKLVPTFKNATYWSNEVHWNWAIQPNSREKASFLKENLLPLQEAGQLKFIPKSGQIVQNVFPDVSVFFANGHTESMMLPMIQYKGTTVIYMADLIPSAGHIPMPYIMSYDLNAMDTLKEKDILLNVAADNGHILFFEHDPVIECCTVQHTEKGVRMKEILKLDAI